MSATDVLLKERAALCDTLAQYGGEAPTLCEGWLTADLAAHLLAREKRPDAGPGILLPGPFKKHTQRVMDQYKAKGYDVMVQELRHVPKLFRIGPMAALNVGENWIHHEDVRRANGEGPRPADPEIDEILWNSLKTSTLIARRKLKTRRTRAPHAGRSGTGREGGGADGHDGRRARRARAVHVRSPGVGRRASRRAARSDRAREGDEARDLNGLSLRRRT